MYGYILTTIGMILVIVLIFLFLIKPGNAKATKKERIDEKKGLSRTEPSAEQVQPASEQASETKTPKN